MAQFTLRLPDDLVPQIDAAAQNLGVSRTVFIARTLAGAVRDDTPRPSPAGREAKSEAVDARPARPAAASRPGASRPTPSTCLPSCRPPRDHHARCPNHKNPR